MICFFVSRISSCDLAKLETVKSFSDGKIPFKALCDQIKFILVPEIISKIIVKDILGQSDDLSVTFEKTRGSLKSCDTKYLNIRRCVRFDKMRKDPFESLYRFSYLIIRRVLFH